MTIGSSKRLSKCPVFMGTRYRCRTGMADFMRSMGLRAALALSLALPLASFSSPAGTQPQYLSFRPSFALPAEISSLSLAAVRRLEEGRPLGGLYARYEGSGKVGSLFIRNKKAHSSLPPSLPSLDQERDDFIAKIIFTRSSSIKTDVLARSRQQVPGYKLAFSMAKLKTSRAGKVIDEYVYVTSHENHLLIFRYSVGENIGSDRQASDFVSGLARLFNRD